MGDAERKECSINDYGYGIGMQSIGDLVCMPCAVAARPPILRTANLLLPLRKVSE